MENESNVLVHIDGKGICKLKLVGQIKYDSNAKGLNEFINANIVEKNMKHVIVDLRECDFIDSTDIGHLVRIAKVQQEKGAEKTTLVYFENSSVAAAIESVNVACLFEVCVDCEMGDNHYENLANIHASKPELAKIMLNNHKILSDLNDENKIKFESVVKYLSGEVSAMERKTTYIPKIIVND